MRLSAIKTYWPLIAISLIILLGVSVRIMDYKWPYLRNIDSYNFYSEMENIVQNNGKLSTTDELKLAPYGSGRGGNIFVYLGAYSYMIFSVFAPTVQLWQYLIWFPAVLASLMAIPMYFIGKILYDRKAGVLAAFFIVFDIPVITRTLGGDPDNDGIVLLMPLILLTAFLIAYKHIQAHGFNKKAFVYSSITGIFFAAWIFSWGGFWYMAWLMTGFIVLVTIMKLISYKNFKATFNEMKKYFISLLVIFSVAFLIVIPQFGFPSLFDNIIIDTIKGPLQFGDIKAETGEFPNVYVSVAELQAPSGPREIIQRTGPPFFVMIAALLYLLYSFARKRHHSDTIILLGIWFIGPFIATVVAVRFSILFSAPIAVGSAILFSKIIRLITGEDAKIED